jgi:hypothetical protein
VATARCGAYRRRERLVNVQRRTVLHVRRSFFHATETFLFHLVSGLEYWDSVLACRERINEANFCLPGTRTVSTDLRLIRPFTKIEWLQRTRLSFSLGDARAVRKVKLSVVHAHFGVEGVAVANVC